MISPSQIQRNVYYIIPLHKVLNQAKYIHGIRSQLKVTLEKIKLLLGKNIREASEMQGEF